MNDGHRFCINGIAHVALAKSQGNPNDGHRVEISSICISLGRCDVVRSMALGDGTKAFSFRFHWVSIRASHLPCTPNLSTDLLLGELPETYHMQLILSLLVRSIRLSVCGSVSLSVCLFVCLFVCLSGCMSVSWSACLSACLSVCRYACLVRLSVGRSVPS